MNISETSYFQMDTETLENSIESFKYIPTIFAAMVTNGMGNHEPDDKTPTSQNPTSAISTKSSRTAIQDEESAKFFCNDELFVASKARQYNYPCSYKVFNFNKVAGDVQEYEDLLERAMTQGIDWDEKEYDPVALEQMIEHTIECDEAEERKHSNDLRDDYFAAIGLI